MNGLEYFRIFFDDKIIALFFASVNGDKSPEFIVENQFIRCVQGDHKDGSHHAFSYPSQVIVERILKLTI